MKKVEKMIDEMEIKGTYMVDFPKEKLSIIFEEDDFFGDDFRNGTLYCFHRRHRLGDEHDFETPKELEDFMKKSGRVYLPLYLYDHGSLTIKTTPFSCPWDSGQVGYIVATEGIMDELKGEAPGAIERFLEAEVARYNSYLNNEIEIVSILDENKDVIDSFYVGRRTLDETVQSLMEKYNLLDSEYIL